MGGFTKYLIQDFFAIYLTPGAREIAPPVCQRPEMLEPDQPQSPGKEITENPLAFIHVIKFLTTSAKTPMNEKLSFFNHPKAFVVTNHRKKKKTVA